MATLYDEWERLALDARLALLHADDSEQEQILQALPEGFKKRLALSGLFRARDKQLRAILSTSPTTLALAGRGFGKTFVGSHWAIRKARRHPGTSIALVAETAADARDYLIETGPSSILRQSPPDFVPEYEPSKRRLTWPNGSVATSYAGDKPDQLRGFSGAFAWIDELAKYRHAAEVMEQLDYSLREGEKSEALITTTPRPIPVIRSLISDESCLVIRGSSWENKHNLSQRFQSKLQKAAKTRLGRQEIYAEILDDAPGALWSRDSFVYADEAPALTQIVVAVDPSTTKSSTSDEAGIVIAGKMGGKAYVLADLSDRLSPSEWAQVAAAAYRGDLTPVRAVPALRHLYRDYPYGPADVIVAERNQGGEMVRSTLRSAHPKAHVETVHAKRGKKLRAQPVAALYEAGDVVHVGSVPALEDQMTSWDPDARGSSPDRIDALVYAVTHLLLKDKAAGLAKGGIVEIF